MMKKRAAGTGTRGKREIAWWRQGGMVGYKPSTSSSWKIQQNHLTGLTGTTDDHLKGYDSNGIPSEAPDFTNYQLNVDTNTTTLQRLNSPEFVYRKQKPKKKKSPPPV